MVDTRNTKNSSGRNGSAVKVSFVNRLGSGLKRFFGYEGFVGRREKRRRWFAVAAFAVIAGSILITSVQWRPPAALAVVKLTYNTAGLSQFVVPEGVTTLQVKGWGAGGGGAGGGNSSGSGGSGGGGGFAQADLTVTSGQVFNVKVGAAGTASTAAGVIAGGGGLTGVYSGTESESNYLLIAGSGGGGGRGNSTLSGGAGGAGGGTNGTAGATGGASGGGITGGGGGGAGTDTTGGTAGAAGSNGAVGTAGAVLASGTGGSTGNWNGGSGGGGRYGGGGGGSGGNATNSGGGGGGGSGKVTGANTTLTAGSGANAANTIDFDYLSPAGAGGGGSTSASGSAGNAGLIVIRYATPVSSLSPNKAAAGDVINPLTINGHYFQVPNVMTPTSAGASAGTAQASGTTTTPTLGFTPQQGDLVLVHISYHSATAPTPPASQGWTLKIDEQNASAINSYVYWKRWGVSGVTDDSSPTFTVPNVASIATISAWRNVDVSSSDPFVDAQETEGNSTTMTAPGASSFGGNTTVLRVYATSDDNTPNAASTGTNLYSTNQTTTEPDLSHALTYETGQTSTTVATATMAQSVNGADAYVAFTLVLKPLRVVSSVGAAASVAQGSGTTATPALGFTPATGDILVAHLSYQSATAPTPPASQGWTLKIDEQNGSAINSYVYYKRWGSGDTDDSSPTFTIPNVPSITQLSAWRGAVTTGDPFVDATEAESSNTTMTAPAATNTTLGSTSVLRLYATSDDNTPNAQSAGTNLYSTNQTSTEPDLSHALSYELGSTTVGTATMTQSANGADAYVAFTLVFKPVSVDISLTKLGESDIVCADVAIVNVTQVTCTLTLASDVATGAWDVELTDAGGLVSTLVEGFTVLTPPTITAVDPVTAFQGDTVTDLQITGTDFSANDGGGQTVTVVYDTTTPTFFDVPTGVTSVTVKAWGAGGGGAAGGTAIAGGAGGGGGFVQGTLAVTAGDSLSINVGGAGGAGAFSSGAAGTSDGDGGGGGGRSEVLRTNDGTVLVTAAGGGGGGGGDNAATAAGGAGGAGGGTSGVAGSASSSALGGGLGSSTAGGSAGTGGANGTAGSFHAGGAGGTEVTACGTTGVQGGGGTGGVYGGGAGGQADVATNGCAGGGGGGSGYYGGGGGSGSVSGNAGGGGGGGGSSFVGAALTSTSNTAGSGTTPGNNGDGDYGNSAGVGGAGGGLSTAGTVGNNGRIVLTYTSPADPATLGVKLTKAGQSDITCANTTFVSATELNCDLTIAGNAAVGYWDVVVTNPSGLTDTLTNGFFITGNAAASVTLAGNSVVGATGDTTLTLTIPANLANTDTVVFTMPPNLNVNNVAYSSDTFAGAGSFSCADSGQVVTCSANGAITAGTGNIVMSGITARYPATGQTVTSIAVVAGGLTIASDTSGTVTNTTANAPTITNVNPNTGYTYGGTSTTITGTNFWSSAHHSREIKITNGGGSTLTDYQVSLVVDTATLVTAGKMQSDCDDIRFTDAAATLPYHGSADNLPYYIYSGCNTHETKIWVRVPSIPTGDSSIFLNYGDSALTAGSNGDNTFLFFDNFTDGTIDTAKWLETDSGTNVTETSGKLAITGTTASQGVTSAVTFDRATAGEDFVTEFNVKQTNTAVTDMFVGFQDTTGITNTNFIHAMNVNASAADDVYEYDSAGTVQTNGVDSSGTQAWTQNQDYRVRIRPKQNAVGALYERSSDAGVTWSTWYNSSQANTNVSPLRLSMGVMSSTGPTAEFDDVFVRRYAATEPVVTANSISTVPVTITHSGSTLTDYAVLVNANTAELIADGLMRSDCGDIRFTSGSPTSPYASSSGQLSYWVESGLCNTANTKIWVKVASVAAGDTTIYMSYGNLSLTSAASGAGTFVFFDDFNTGTVIDTGKWAVTGNSANVFQGSGRLNIASTTALVGVTSVGTFDRTTSGADFVTEFTARQTNTATTTLKMGFQDATGMTDTNFIHAALMDGASTSLSATDCTGAGSCSTTFPFSASKDWTQNTDYRVRIRPKQNADGAVYDRSSDGGVTWEPWVATTSPSTNVSPLYLSFGRITSSGPTAEFDDVFVRKWTTTEPTVVVNLLPSYTKALTVTNTGSTLTDYPVAFTLDTDALVDAGQMRSDCGDLRFTSGSPSNPYVSSSGQLSYWVESGCNTTTTKIWVEVPSIANGANTIYMSYGNLSLASAASGSGTFTFFDDFDDGWIDTAKWGETDGGTNVTETAGRIAITGTNSNQGVTSAVTFDRSTAGADFAAEFTVKQTNTDATDMFIGFQDTTGITNTNFIHAMNVNAGAADDVYEYNSAGTVQTNGANSSGSLSWTQNADYRVRIRPKQGAVGAMYERSSDGGATWGSWYDSTQANTNVSPLRLSFGKITGGGFGPTAEFDNVLVRKWTATEPTVSVASTASTASSSVTTGDTAYGETDGFGSFGSIHLTVGGTDCAALSVTNSTTLVCSTPVHAAGAVDVVVTNADAQTDTEASGFTYTVYDPVASVALAGNATVGGSGNTTLTLTTPVSLAVSDTVVFTMPANLNVSGAAFASETFGGVGTFGSCNASGQTITCTVIDGTMTAGTGTIVMTGITANYAATSQTVTNVTVNDTSNAGLDVALDTSGAVTDTVAGDAAASLALAGNATVGTAGNTTLTLTIPSPGMANTDTVTFTVPANLNPASVAFGSETFAGAGTFSGCSASGQDVTCTANGVITAGTGTIVMTGIVSIYTATSQTVTNVAVNDTSASGADIAFDASGTVTDTVAGDAAASVTLAGNATVGGSGNTTLTLTIHAALANTDTVVFTLPANLDVSGAAFASETFAGAGTFSSCTPSSQTITCTANGAITAGTGNIVMTGIVSLYAATSQTMTNLAVNDTSASGADISADTSGTVTNTVAGDAAASVTLAGNATVGGTGNTTLTFTLASPGMANTDTATFTMPANLNVASAAFASETFAGAGTFSSCTPSSQTITCTANGVISAGTGNIVMTGIVANYAATGQTVTNLAVNDTSASGADISADTSGTVTDTVAGDAAASVTLAGNATVGGSGNTTLTFTLASPGMANTDTVVFTMPANLDVSGVAFSSETFSGAGTFSSCTPSSQTITCTANGVISAGTGNIVMTGIVANYAATGQTVTNLAVNDTSASGADISADTSGTVTDTVAGDAAASVTLAGNATVGGTGNTTLTLTIPAPGLANTDTIVFTMPNNLNVSSVAFGSETFSGAGTLSGCSAASQTITCTANGVISAGTGNIVMTGIVANYAATGQTMTNLAVNDTSASGADISADTSGTVTDTVAGDAAASVTLAGNATVGVSGDTTLTLSIPSPGMANTDTVVFTMPANLNVSSVAFGSETFSGAGTFSGCSSSGQIITCTANGVISAGTGNIVMSGIAANYEATGQTVTSLAVNDTSESGADIVTDASGTVTDTVAGDANASVTLAGNATVGGTGNTTLTLTIPVNLAADDSIVFAMPSNLDIDSIAYASDTFGGAGVFTCGDLGQLVLCSTTDVITAGTGNIVMTGVLARYAATGQTITSLTVSNESVGADIVTDASGTVTDTVAGDAAASVTLAGNATVGGSGNTTLTFTLASPGMANTDTVVFTMPANLDVSSVAFASETFAGAGTFSSCTPSSQTITCTANGVITAGTGTIVMTGIVANYAATGQVVTDLAVNDTSASGGDISADASGTVTDTVAGDAAASVTLAGNATVGGSGNTTLTLTIASPGMANTDTVTFTMPDPLNVSGVAFSSETFAGAGTFSSCSPSGQTITCTANGVITAGTGNIVMTGITANYAATEESVTDVAVNDTSASGADISADASGTVTDTVAADANASVTLAGNAAVGGTGNTTLTFTLPSPGMANTDTVVFTLPANLDIASTAFASETFSGAGTFSSCTPSGQTITCSANGVISAGTGNIVMTGITALYAATGQVMTNLAVNDTSASGADIATDASGTVTDTTVADANASVTLAGNATVGGTGNTTLTLTIPAPGMANTDTIVFTMPNNLNVSSVAFASETFSGAGTLSGCSASGQIITCSANGAVTGTGNVVMTGITALYAATGQTVTNLAVNDTSEGGADIASDASGTVTDTVAADANASVTLGANAFVGIAGNTTLTLSIPSPGMANTDTVVFTMPANLDVNSVAFSSETFGGAGTFSSCTDSGQTITCTTNGVISAGTGNIVMSGILATSVATGQAVTNVTVNDTSASGADIAFDASGTVTDTAAAADADDSTFTASPTTGVVANGTASSKLTVTLKDSALNLLVGKTVAVSKSGPGTITYDAINCDTNVTLSNTPPNEADSDSDGQACFKVTTTVAGTYTFTAVVDPENVTLTTQPTVAFVAGTVSVGNSTVAMVGGVSSAPADGETTLGVVVTVRDANNNPIAGRDIEISDSEDPGEVDYIGYAMPTPYPEATTNASGQVTFDVTSLVSGVYTFTATDVTGGGSTVIGTVDATFTCVMDENQQCIEVDIDPAAGILTVSAPSDFSFPALTSSFDVMDIFSINAPGSSYVLNTDDVITVTDTGNFGGFTLQLQAGVFEDSSTSEQMPLTDFWVVTKASSTGGDATAGVEYPSGYSGVEGITAPQDTAGSLSSRATFTADGSALDQIIDLMLAPVTEAEIGRNGTFKQNVQYHLRVPAMKPAGDYSVTLTFDLTRTVPE